MTKKERQNRIIARGEHSDHCHVVVGGEVDRNESGEIIIKVGKEGAILKHLIESAWVQGNEVWTKEHKDININPGVYKYIPQIEFDPFDNIVRRVID